MSARLKVGLVGAGAMGSLHARVLASNPRTVLGWVSDPYAASGRALADRFGAAYLSEPSYSAVDAVVVAVPTQFHHDVGLEVISSGRPLLLEKPLANALPEVRALLSAAERAEVPIMCGLLERFNSAVRTAFELSRSPLHFRSVRHSPMTDRIQTGVAGDLLIHDLDLALRLFDETPTTVLGLSDQSGRRQAGVEDIVEVLLRFGHHGLASLSASRRSQRKIRTIMIAESDRLIEVDLLRQDVTIYRHVLESAADDDLGYRQQTIIDVPVLRHHGEPLMLQLEHFVDIVEGLSDPVVERKSILPAHAVLGSLAGDESTA